MQSPQELFATFTSTYKQSLTTNTLKYHPSLFYDNLKQSSILWNEEAETFMKERNVLEYPVCKFTEIYDNMFGFVVINEYSHIDTDSFSKEEKIEFS